MRCSVCGFENNDGQRYCNKCGRLMFSENMEQKREARRKARAAAEIKQSRIRTAVLVTLIVIVLANMSYIVFKRITLSSFENAETAQSQTEMMSE